MLDTLPGEIVGTSADAERLRTFIELASRSSLAVTIAGEAGTGKQAAARLIHEKSPRGKGPFLMVDCSLFFERELKRELFGYVAAGTGRQKSRKGLLEFANQGTCYLSRIEELSTGIQASLLELLETGKFARLGDGKVIASRVRLIVSSSKNLPGFVEAGLFDAALRDHLSRLHIQLSPLRGRSSDIPAIIEDLWRRQAPDSGASALAVLTPEAIQALQSYPWPGNLDELESEIKRLYGTRAASIGPAALAMEISSCWLGQRGDPEVRKVIDELEGHIREFRVLSRLDLSYGELLQAVGENTTEMPASSRDNPVEP